jgi:4-amino-4-deoxy-L-arabinose transferase-like glycosyltransferase
MLNQTHSPFGFAMLVRIRQGLGCVSTNPVALFFILGFCLRLFAVLFFQGQFNASDTLEYVAIADNILGGKGYSINGHLTVLVTPVYPLLIATIFLISMNNLMMVQLLQIFVGAATVSIIYLLARKLFRPRIAFWAALIVSVHPWVIYWTGFVLTETVFLFLLCLSALLFLEMMKTPSLRAAVGVGVSFGLASLCRPLGLVIFVSLLIASPLLFRQLRRNLRYLAVAALLLLVVMSPWIVRNYLVFGQFIPTSLEQGYSLYVGNNPNASLRYGVPEPGRAFLPAEVNGMTESQMNSYLQGLALSYIIQNPTRFAELVIVRFYLFWSPIYPTYSFLHDLINCVLYLALYFAAVVGLNRLYKRERPGFWFFFALLAVPTLVQSITIVDLDQRFRLPLQPFLAILAAYGLDSIRGFHRSS